MGGGCSFEVLSPAVLGCFLSVEKHIQAFPCYSHFPRTSQSPLGNMLTDLALEGLVQFFPTPGLEPQCSSDNTKCQLPLEYIMGREIGY